MDLQGDAAEIAGIIAEFGDTITAQSGDTFRAIVDTRPDQITTAAGALGLTLTGEPAAVFYFAQASLEKIGPDGLVQRKERTWKSGVSPDDADDVSFSDVTLVRTLVFFLQPNSETVGRVLNQWARVIKVKQGNVVGSISKTYTPAAQNVPCRVEAATSESEGITGEQVQATAKVKILLPLDAAVSARDRIAVGTEAQLASPNQAGATIYEVVGADSQAADQTVQAVRVIRIEKVN